MDIIEKTVIDSAQNWLNMYQLNWEEKNEVKNNNDILLKEKLMKKLEREMKEAAKALDFETAATLRDAMLELKIELGS